MIILKEKIEMIDIKIIIHIVLIEMIIMKNHNSNYRYDDNNINRNVNYENSNSNYRDEDRYSNRQDFAKDESNEDKEIIYVDSRRRNNQEYQNNETFEEKNNYRNNSYNDSNKNNDRLFTTIVDDYEKEEGHFMMISIYQCKASKKRRYTRT